MKDAYYFPHDSNARHDPRIIALCSKYGLIAYAWYFQMIEILRDQDNYELDESLTCVLANAWQSYSDAMQVKRESDINEILETMVSLKLVVKSGGKLSSPSLKTRMMFLDDLRRKRAEAGRAGNAKRWQSDRKAIASYRSKGKERKVKDSPLPPKGGFSSIPENREGNSLRTAAELIAAGEAFAPPPVKKP